MQAYFLSHLLQILKNNILKSILNSITTGSSISYGPHISVPCAYHVDFLNILHWISQKVNFSMIHLMLNTFFVDQFWPKIQRKMSNITFQKNLYLRYQLWFKPLKRVYMIRNETFTVILVTRSNLGVRGFKCWPL